MKFAISFRLLNNWVSIPVQRCLWTQFLYLRESALNVCRAFRFASFDLHC